MLDAIVLLIAGLFGGMLNAIAGGGSFITFPALLFVGVPPIMANATNTFASCAGYISGVYGYRSELKQVRETLTPVAVVSIVGGVIGAILLLHTPDSQFDRIIPYLMLLATLMFTFGPSLNKRLMSSKPAPKMLTLGVLLLVATYGGFFNAGLGIISLSFLSLAGYTNIHLMNGIKLLISTAVSIVAIGIFIVNGTIDWFNGALVMVGTLIGGYVAAKLTRTLPQVVVRRFVIALSVVLTCYFFIV
ncbi:sulfite exporter TauE/SafE family protein [Vibrio sp. SCSIO 43136]|uniref:sulfite exporter TauE/SafE family protein n=1 Tax=Vibrio sp. SCSIO 43136 TaxID=2819101 RepID=UPI002075BA3F|nr:sulfite exporter TauE/SafE family protein [Vibrio sp. SCSIO 43136]USD67186.1 sulfite exporter TauE/SafE family protein [Vibrio sp. SCSIO 43136]